MLVSIAILSAPIVKEDGCICSQKCPMSLDVEACLYGCQLPVAAEADAYCHSFTPSMPPAGASGWGGAGVRYAACMAATEACGEAKNIETTNATEVAVEAGDAELTCAKDGECAPHWDILRGPTGCCSNSGVVHKTLLCKTLFRCGPATLLEEVTQVAAA